MRAKTLILFVIAVGCGLVASIGVSQYMDQKGDSGADGSETAKIFVALTDIGIGQELDANNVKLEDWPRDRIPDGAITDLADLEGHFPRTRLYAGEPILKAKLMSSNDGSKSVDIPKGFRVVSVQVTMKSAVSGLVQPGDRVDLLVFLRKSAEVPQTGTRTILKDVNVFAVDSETERSVGDDGEARDVRTVSLLVKPEQAETVMLASELGELFLALRRPDDDVEEDSEGITIQELLGNKAEAAGDQEAAMAALHPEAGGLIQWLTNSVTQPTTVPVQAPLSGEMAMNNGVASSQPVPEVAEPPVWTMRILTPEGVREFQWHDEAELPSEVVPGEQGSAPAGLTSPISVDVAPVQENPFEQEEEIGGEESPLDAT